jgi:hypothetical protein
MAEMGKRFRVVFIEASQEERFERMKARSRSGDVQDFSRFQSRDEQQRRMGLDDIRDDLRTVRWNNMSTVREFLATIDAEVVKLPRASSSVEEMLRRVRTFSRIKLEDAIMVALLSKWSNDETRQYFTTSEIARIINQIVNPTSRKHKDNVSRYFNQNYYVYYEISSSEGKPTRRYRLSNTGYGRAVQTIRNIIGRKVEE